MKSYYTKESNFYGNTNPHTLIEKYGGPLYVYNERILRQRCREMRNLVSYPEFKPNYSIKANSNLTLLKIVNEEGLCADAMSPGEIYVLLKAGFIPENILYISNNVSWEEMNFAVEHGITVSIDSISQLELYGRNNPGGSVAVRFNPGVGAGHHEKVVTGGKKTKFGVNMDFIDKVKEVLKKYDLKLIGINQHIGSLFMEGTPYIEGVSALLEIAGQFENLEFIDLGGGFGIPYRKQDGEGRLDLKTLGERLDEIIVKFTQRYGRNITFKIEPGRYISAECGVLLGTVHSIKDNYGIKYVGTDLGMNVLVRPSMYGSHHDLEVYRNGKLVNSDDKEPVTVVGNICESGDMMASDRMLPKIFEGDIIGVMDAGAYGYSMCSNYNNRLRPAEVLINEENEDIVIRRRDTFEDIVKNFEI